MRVYAGNSDFSTRSRWFMQNRRFFLCLFDFRKYRTFAFVKSFQPGDFLPTTRKEVELRGWDELDVILFSGDAYIDHPSFGTAVIGRLLEAEGLKVAIVPQPNWRDDLRDFKKLGAPRLFFGISAGCMDSMVNHYTANKRTRSEDAYSPDGRTDLRPDRTTIIYSNILKKLYPDTPVVIGGIEASLRRFTHYDYWEDKLMPGILVDSKADLLVYGMGEKPLKEIVKAPFNSPEGGKLGVAGFMEKVKNIRQVAYLLTSPPSGGLGRALGSEGIFLHSHEDCLKSKRKSAENFRIIETESNKWESKILLQKTGKQILVVNPPYEPMTTEEIDASFDLPYTRLPHPKYKGKTIPAFDMIRFSVNLHRGCFGGCAFCTISAHQGKQVVSRSKKSILKEVKNISEMPGFKGYISDLGGPSANMYGIKGKDENLCRKCAKPSCIFPVICKNLNADLHPLLDIYRSVDALPCIKKSFVGSGVRYDMLAPLNPPGGDFQNRKNSGASTSLPSGGLGGGEYIRELITRHVSGRLKVAPEHTSDEVLKLMRKPSFRFFEQFNKLFEKINSEKKLNQQLIPYFISSHPGCRAEDMAQLAQITKKLHFKLEQVQDFTPTPMTLATEMYYTGLNPYTMKPVYCARTKDEKLKQHQSFFWYKNNQNEKSSNNRRNGQR